MIKKYILGFGLAFGLFVCSTSANAMYFADFVYLNVRKGNVDSVRRYLQKGYALDATNPNGMTALCRAVDEGNYKVYRKLRQLGANEKHRCMNVVNQQTAEEFSQKYSPLTDVQGNGGDERFVVYKDEGMTGKQYAAVGAVAAAVAGVGILVADDDDGGKGIANNINKCEAGYIWDGEKCISLCPAGEMWDGTQCVPINCAEGEVWNGSECVPNISCPTGERWNGTQCVPIVCPENTHLVGNLCVADGDVVVDNSGDEPVYGINSKVEDVFNIYSSPKVPDDSASITINKTGNGDAWGIYGISNVFNSYNVGEKEGVVNPIGSGSGNISITSNGTGSVYGLYAKIADITQYKEAINASGWNKGVAYGDINIAHQGGGASYGVFGDVRAYNALAAHGGKSYGDITIHGDGDIYGVSGYVVATNAVSPYFGNKVIGNINLYQQGNHDVYGMMVSKDDIPGAGAGDNNTRSWFAFNAYASGGDDVEGNINIRNNGNGNAYGMYGGNELYNAMSFGGVDEETGLPNGHARGNINILNVGSGTAYGMYLPDDGGHIENSSANGARSTIKIVNSGSGRAIGLQGGKESVILNSGEIDINNLGSGTAIGIYGEENSTIENSGIINIHRDSYKDDETGVMYNPTGSVGGIGYGIYAEKGANVVNSGDITITGVANGQGIYLAEGATLENTGTVSFNGVLQNETDRSATATTNSGAEVNLDKFGGEVILGKGGKFFAEELSGKLGVSKNMVLDNMEKEYVLSDALNANDVSKLDVYSKSAMFIAKKKENSNGNTDVVLSKKALKDVLQNKSFGRFLDENYDDKNGGTLFNVLAQAETEDALNREAQNLSGDDVLPNFRKENALVYRRLSKQFDDNLFNKPDEHYMGGYKFMDISLDDDGMLSGSDATAHAAYGMVKGKADNGVTYGLGATAARLKSDYDNGASRKSNVFGLWMPVGYDFKNGTQWYSKLYAGYSDGSYDRKTSLGKYSADITEYQYGLSNEFRHKMDLGRGFSFEPLAELNLLGIYQDGFNEGTSIGAFDVDSNNSLSLEGGLGAYLTKEFMFNDDNKLGIQIGGVYYVEFLDPDDGFDMTMRGVRGKYKLNNKSQDGYAVFSLRANYTYKDLMLYAVLEQETGRSKAFTVDTGIQYKF